jgi:hypothetical protein
MKTKKTKDQSPAPAPEPKPLVVSSATGLLRQEMVERIDDRLAYIIKAWKQFKEASMSDDVFLWRADGVAMFLGYALRQATNLILDPREYETEPNNWEI